MIDYREIIRLKSAGYSNSSVASSTGSGRNKVAEVWKRAGEKNISWPIPGSLTNSCHCLISLSIRCSPYITPSAQERKLFTR